MTFKKKLTGRHALRSSTAVAALVGVHHHEATRELDAWQVTDATRNVVAHTTQEWNALRHSC